eukprot:scaffold1009_cov188-Alexandrium_tamarense.AAC.30
MQEKRRPSSAPSQWKSWVPVVTRLMALVLEWRENTHFTSTTDTYKGQMNSDSTCHSGNCSRLHISNLYHCSD